MQSEQIDIIDTLKLVGSIKGIGVIILFMCGFLSKLECQYSNEVSRLIKTNWHQKSPYNSLCPVYERTTLFGQNKSKNSLLGCGAVAIGQILRYYEYPTQPSGIAAYCSTAEGPVSPSLIEGNFCFYQVGSSLNYNYRNMAECDYESGNLDVASFLRTVAIFIVSNFDVNGSYKSEVSSGSLDIVSAMINNFGYNISSITPSNHYRAGSILRSDLVSGRPILGYLSNVAGGGHWVVIDGFKWDDILGRYVYHVNMGWEDSSLNQYYDLESLPLLNGRQYEFTYFFSGIQPRDPDYTLTPRADYCEAGLKTDSEQNRTSLSCISPIFPVPDEVISNQSIQVIWEEVEGALAYEVTIKSVGSSVIYYEKTRTYGGHEYFEAPESLPPNDEIEVTINPVDEFGVVHQCDPYTFFTVSEPCDVDIVDVEIECASFTEYDLIVEFDETGAGTYNLRAEDPDNVYAELNNIEGGTYTLSGIPNRRDVAIIVEKTSDTEHCFEIVNVSGPRCHSSTFDFTWPPSEDECYETGEDLPVTWEEYGNTAVVRLALHNLLTSEIAYETNFVINDGDHTLTIPEDVPEGYYIIRIIAADDPTASAQSLIFEIKEDCTTECEPVNVSLFEPAGGAIKLSGEDIDFLWYQNGPVTGPCSPQEYVFEIADNTSFDNAQEVVRTSNDLSTSISTVGEYYWRVRVHYTNGNYGPWSAVRSLTISDPENVVLNLQGCTQYATPICKNELLEVDATLYNNSGVTWEGSIRAAIWNIEESEAQLIEEHHNLVIASGESIDLEFSGIVTMDPHPGTELYIIQEADEGSQALPSGGSCQNGIDIDINYCEDALDFDWNPTVIIEDEPVSFDDIYPGPILYTRWYFEGGTPDSILDNSNASGIIFEDPGLYEVTCEVETVDLGILSKTKTIEVLSTDAFYPDLYFETASLSHPQALENQYIDVDWTVINDGVQKIKFNWIEYYFSDDAILDSLDHKYTYTDQEDLHSVYLSGGASFNGSRNVKVPNNTTNGTKYIIVKLYSWNPPHREPDQDPVNDILAIPIEIITELPDITMQNVYLSQSVVRAGEAFDVGVEFVNIGNGDLPTTYPPPAYNMYLSTDTILSSDDLDYGRGHWIENGSWSPPEYHFDEANGAEPFYHERNVKVSELATEGQYYLLLAIDLDLEYPHRSDVESESNEANNVVYASLEIANPNQPSSQAHDLRVISKDETSISLCWSRGNGSAAILLGYDHEERGYRKPVDSLDYSTDSNWSIAPAYSDGERTRPNTKMLYQGVDTCVTVNGLDSGESYFFSVFEYNEDGSGKDYLQSKGEVILSTTDGDESIWDIHRTTPSHNDFFSTEIHEIFPHDEEILTFGYYMLKSMNNGEYFKMYRIEDESETHTISSIGAAHISDSNIVAVHRGGGVVYRSSNLGEEWSKSLLAQADRSYAVHFTDAEHGFLVSRDTASNGIVFKTNDGGVTWVQVLTSADLQLREIDVLEQQVFVAGEDAVLFRSNDFGDTWMRIYHDLPTSYITDVKILGSSTLLATVRDHGLYYSIDGGYTWESKNDMPAETSGHEMFVNEDSRIYFNYNTLAYASPELSSWSAMSHNVSYPNTCFLNHEGRIYIAGRGLQSALIDDLSLEDCPEHLIIQGQFASEYESSSSIVTDGQMTAAVESNSRLASSSVVLNPGVHVEPGAVFVAEVDPCDLNETAGLNFEFTNISDLVIGYDQLDILWSSTNLSETVELTLLDSDSQYVQDIDLMSPNDGYYSWEIDSTILAGTYVLSIQGYALGDSGAVLDTLVSYSEELSIVPAIPQLDIYSPSSGQSYTADVSLVHIQWTSQYVESHVELTLVNKAGTQSWTIDGSTEDDNYYAWNIPSGIPTDDYYIVIAENSSYMISDTSDLFEIISVPMITFTSPQDGESYTTGEDAMNINWTSSNVGPEIVLQLVDADSNFVVNLVSQYNSNNPTDNDGEFEWDLPITLDGGYHHIKAFEHGTGNAVSYSGEFEILVTNMPMIEISQPWDGQVRSPGSSLSIRWTSINITDDVVIELLDANDNHVSFISTSTNDDGFFPWSIPNNINLGDYKVKMYEVGTEDGVAYSGTFTIE